MSGSEDLDDISQMLKAQDNKEDIPFDELENGVSEEDALNYIRNLGEEQPIAAENVKRRGKWKFNKWNVEKKGFFHKIAQLLFGAESETEQPIHIHPSNDIEDTTAENDEIIKSVEKEAALAEKKAKKEERKKAQEQKKEARKKEQDAKKKIKAAEKKEAMAKKVKAPKEVDKTPPLPKKPVFLIFLLAFSLLGGTIFAANGIHYSLCLRSATEAYGKAQYIESYGHLRRTKLKEKDDEFVRKVAILASMQELLESHPTLYKADEHEMALDTLIRVIGRYNDNLEEAEALGALSEISKLEAEAEALLEDEYGLTYEDAMKLYSMTSRKKYSAELVKILREAGVLR